MQFAAWATLYPFLTVILSAKNLSEFEIGVLMSCLPLCKFVGAPLGGFLFDRSGESKLFWCIILLLASLSVQLLQVTNSLPLLMLIASTATFCGSPIMGITNHSVLVHLGERKKAYGRYRLWGAVSWGVISPLMGVLLTYQPDYLAFALHFLGMSMVIFFVSITKFTYTTPEPPPDPSTELEAFIENLSEENLTEPSPDPPTFLLSEGEQLLDPIIESSEMPEGLGKVKDANVLRQLVEIIWKREVLVFYALVYLMGVATYLISGFLFLFLKDLGGSETLLGISVTFTVSTEIPLFFFSGWLLTHFGEEWLIAAAMMSYILRVVGYSLLWNPWLVLPLELFHGLTFGAMYAAGINYSSNMFPPHLSATGQGIFNGLYGGLGPFTGSLVGGYIYEHYGARVMFRIMASLVSVGLLVLLVTFRANLSKKATHLWLLIKKTISTFFMTVLEKRESSLTSSQELTEESNG